MKPIFIKILAFTNPSSLEHLHPIVLKTCKSLEDFIGCLDTNIHFTTLHATADKQLQAYPIGNIMNRYDNIIIPETGRTMWDLKEASQATAFNTLTPYGVISGTCTQMRQYFPGQNFPSNQANPDVCQNYSKARFVYKQNIGIDYKNMMGKTIMNGQNQVLIGSYECYEMIMNMYETMLFAKNNRPELRIVLAELREFAKNNDWQGQILKFAENLHKFPEKSLPPLYTKEKIHFDTFTSEVQVKIIESKKIMRARTKRAYELNIPEDNFSESDVQKLLSEEFVL